MIPYLLCLPFRMARAAIAVPLKDLDEGLDLDGLNDFMEAYLQRVIDMEGVYDGAA